MLLASRWKSWSTTFPTIEDQNSKKLHILLSVTVHSQWTCHCKASFIEGKECSIKQQVNKNPYHTIVCKSIYCKDLHTQQKLMDTTKPQKTYCVWGLAGVRMWVGAIKGTVVVRIFLWRITGPWKQKEGMIIRQCEIWKCWVSFNKIYQSSKKTERMHW